MTADEVTQAEMQAYKLIRPHENIIRYIESGKKFYFSEKSDTVFKAKLVNYIVVELAQ